MQILIRQFQRLSLPEKVLGVSLFFCFFFTLPLFDWFHQIHITPTANELGRYEEEKTFSAYTGIASVMGYFYALFILSGLGVLILSLKDKYIQQFLETRHWFYVFITGEALFLLVLTFLVYTSYAMQFTQAGVSYGLILTIIANLIALFAAHFFFLQKRKRSIKKSFAQQMQGTVHIEPEKPSINHANTKEDSSKKEEEKQMSLGDL